MKKTFPLFMFLVSFLFIIQLSAQEYSFENLLIQKEQNPAEYLDAKKEAVNLGLPVSIKLPQGILIDVIKKIEGTVLYSVITNAAHPFSDGAILTFQQISQRYDLSNAEINWGVVTGETQSSRILATELLLIPDWTNDNVLSFDPVTGDVINANFIPPNPGNLASPKHALFNPNGFISVSDQITDLVQKFDTSGSYIGIYAPAGGVNNTILDNLRGHAYRPGNGNLLVTVGSGANSHGIPEFDLAGNYLGNFIANGAGGLNSPFCILFRTNDVLVTGSTSDAAHRYDLNGNYISNLISGMQFPQQIIELPNGNLAVAVFSTPSGLGIYDSTGVQLNFFTGVTGLRGVYRIPNGNFLVTNGAGLHEINGTTGSLIRTILAAANLQYISYVNFVVIPVELVSFTAGVSNNEVALSWQTASEINNSGFDIERSSDSYNFVKVGFVQGYGTTTESKFYIYNDNTVNGGKYYYRLKQIDYDGTFEYSSVVEAEIGTPDRFSLEQNYPNPFNPTTTIKYSVPVSEFVTLKVFDILGNEITTLVNEQKEASSYEVTFDATPLSSGVYFYKIQAGSFSDMKKLVLMK